MNNFAYQEAECASTFLLLGEVYHLWTPENFQIIFTNESDFKSGMNIFGLCAKLFPGIIVLTFELMSNHLHITAAGRKDFIMQLFEIFKSTLIKYYCAKGYIIDWTHFKASVRPVITLEDVRNVIAYDNRNGFVVSPDETPFSYRWGGNRFYFNPDAKKLAIEHARSMTLRQKRDFSHSHKFDDIEGLTIVDGYVLPLSFCRIDIGERLFRNASHYFNKVGKSIEAFKTISQEIGESVFYTDDELYTIACRICREKYGAGVPALIPAAAKVELARILHYDYNAQAKKLQRMLKLDVSIINSLF